MIEFLEEKNGNRHENGLKSNENGVKNDIYLKEYYHKVFNEADVNKKGRINFRQFYEVFKKENTTENIDREKLKTAYKRSLDKESNRREIDFEDFFKLIVKVNENFKDFLSSNHLESMNLNDLKLGLILENV